MSASGAGTVEREPGLSIRDKIDYGLAITGSVLSMAGAVLAHEAVFPAAAAADEQCTTSPGGDSTVCVENPPNNPPSDGGGQNPGNGGNNGNGNGGNHHKKPHDTGLSRFYSNPLRDVKHLRPWRIDEGVDYHGHGGVHPIGKAVITLATSNSSFWANEHGNAVVYKLKNGPARGLSVFVAEGCKPNPGLHPGKTVYPDDVICHMYGDNKYPGIEMGWSMRHNSAKKDYPAAQPVYSEGDKTAYGVFFNRFVVKLGAPAGNSIHKGPPYVSSTSYTVGHAPRRYRRLVKLPL